jgi:putative redox protein
MEVTIQHLGDVRFEAQTRGHRVICDQPVGNGGGDTGMTPPELLLVSLGTCAGFYAAEYLKTRHLPAQGLSVKVTADKALRPARLSAFRIDISLPQMEARHLEGVKRAVHACLVHNTLLQPPVIETAVHFPAESEAA